MKTEPVGQLNWYLLTIRKTMHQACLDSIRDPYQVRFTVNRMGVLAHARFLGEPSVE